MHTTGMLYITQCNHKTRIYLLSTVLQCYLFPKLTELRFGGPQIRQFVIRLFTSKLKGKRNLSYSECTNSITDICQIICINLQVIGQHGSPCKRITITVIVELYPFQGIKICDSGLLFHTPSSEKSWIRHSNIAMSIEFNCLGRVGYQGGSVYLPEDTPQKHKSG